MHQVRKFMSQTNVLKHPFKTHPNPSQQAEGNTNYCLYQTTDVEPVITGGLPAKGVWILHA